ncbi:MAG: ligase-associated DNA damage response endonuclease PdeM [Pseudomonadota bacterium]
MIAAHPPRLPFSFAGNAFEVVGSKALYWSAQNALVVADLHLEKASWFAVRGQMLPPYDSLATLQSLAGLINATQARALWCLGDNFHDSGGVERLEPTARRLLGALTAQLDWHWIVGNHDPALGSTIGGTVVDEAEVNGLILRHRAHPDETRAELSGHFHPKYRGRNRSRAVSRACFVISETRLILPAFGALAGGLSADHTEVISMVGPAAEALVPTQGRLLRFKL